MTQLLVSIKSIAEAKIALAEKVDIIDLKNPSDGALGALDAKIIKQIVLYVAGRRPVSATIGNLPMQASVIIQKIQQADSLGLDLIKVGFENDLSAIDCINKIAKLKFKTKLVGVLFADQSPNFELIPCFSAAGFHGLMLDTQSKLSINLFECQAEKEIESFVKKAKDASLLVGLAGRLLATNIASAINFSPDFIGVRSAVCHSESRENLLDSKKISIIKALF